MKSVGIITINDNDNYGNRLQNYAVQNVFKENNVKAITLKNNPTLNLKNNCIYDESYYSDNGENVKYRNLDIIRNLNSKSLKNIYLSGNNGITDYSSISSLNWGDKDF